jgi:hypothetical protein
MPNPAKIVKLLEGIGHIRTQDGIQPLRLFYWQKGYVKAVCEHDEVAVLKSRDIGSSTVAVCLYTLLALIYCGDFVIASYKKDSAKALFETADVFLQNLPPEFAQWAKCRTDTDYHKVLYNGSHITAMEMSERVGRSFRAKYLLASELAFWNNPKDSWQAITGSGVAGMSITAESTPNPGPQGALFESLLDNPQWVKVEQDYHGNPAHTEAWKVAKLAELDGDEARFAQEYECSLEKASTSQSVIPLQAIRDAMSREEPEGLPVVLGVDVARFGDDRSVITIVKGHKVLPPVIIRGMDTQELARKVYDLALEHKAESINVDVIGVGGGVVDALNSLGLPGVNGVNVAEPAWDSDKFANRKAEGWWVLRQRLIDGTLSLPDDKDLERELMCSYKYNLTGRIVIQPKEEVKKALGRSPDMADSLVLALFPRMGLLA